MSNELQLRFTSDMEVFALPVAECEASLRVLRPDQCWVPTTGVNAGKHKLGNNVDTYPNLAFVEGQGGGGGGITALTTDVTASGTGSVAATIAANAVTNAKAADMAQATFKMRAAGAGTGDPIDGTAAQAKTALALVVADVLGAGTMSTVTYPNTYGTFGTSDGDPENPSIPLQSEAQMRTVAQIGHGFAVAQALKVEAGGGGVAALAQGDDAGNASFVGFVFEVTTANQYKVITSGWAAIFTGLTAGAYHYLDPATPGALTTTPNAFGPVLKATSTEAGYVLSNSAFIDTPALRRAALGLPNVYTAILTSAGTGVAPVASVVINQLGGAPVWTNTGDGQWNLELTGAFPAGKVRPFMSYLEATDAVPLHEVFMLVDADNVGFQFFDAADVAAEPTRQKMVHIEVYP